MATLNHLGQGKKNNRVVCEVQDRTVYLYSC